MKSKIYYDILSLKQWMLNCYVNKNADIHYEHIVVPEGISQQHNHCYLFTETDNYLKKGDFGTFRYSVMAEGKHNDQFVHTYIIQSFKINSKQSAFCKWSKAYQRLSYQEGLYIFIEQAPTYHRRFIVENWIDLEPYFPQAFLKFLDELRRNNSYSKKGITELPLLIGYRIPSGETHWQCAIIPVDNFPIYAEKIGSGKYIGKLSNQYINWVQTRNSSYQYFFGRSALTKAITERRILIIGVGAIGSIVATTLTRGGSRDISLIDYDIKEPENVCRSEYQFSTGLNSKVIDLRKLMIDISPFIQVFVFPEFMDVVKKYINISSDEIKHTLEKYEYIFDCSADSDVAYILDTLQLKSEVLSLSITNNAQELVCAIKPGFYQWSQQVFRKLKKDEDDLYQPTGCWSPTFKASYNDINVMVQYAIKHINSLLETGKSLRSFYLTNNNTNGLTIKLNQF